MRDYSNSLFSSGWRLWIRWGQSFREIWTLNKKIKDSDLPENTRIGAIVRGKQVIIPGGDFIFEKDDLVVLLASRDQLKQIENIFSII